MKNLKLYFAAIGMALFSLGAASQTLDEIVKKHIEAIGGKANWAKIKTMKMQGIMKAQGAEIQVTITQIDKKAMRQDISVMGMTGYSIVTNTEGWSFMPFQGQTKPEPMTADDIKNSQDDLYLQDDFLVYKEQGKKLEYLGKDDVDGTECFKIKMTGKTDEEITFYIDPSNYYLIKKTSKAMADGKEQEMSSFYSNYKKLDEGIVYAMNINSGWGETEVQKLEINPVIDESVFKPGN